MLGTEIIRKNNDVHEKYEKDYLILLDVGRNSLFCYKRDTRVIWDYLDTENTLDSMYNRLVEEDVAIERADIEFLIEDMARRGLVLGEGLIPDEEFIKENNYLKSYVDYCNKRNRVNDILLEVTNKCNLRCAHCFHDTELTELGLSTLEKMFKELKETYVISITLTGGEITIYPYWKQLIALAHQYGLLVSIISNFTLMTDDDADYILESNLDMVKTSVYSSEAEVHDKITGEKGSFEKTISRLKYFCDRGKRVDVNVELMKLNAKTAKKTKEYLESLGAVVGFDYRIHPSRSNKKTNEQLVIDSRDFQQLYEDGVVEMPLRTRCMACKNRVRVNQDGEVMACEFLNISLGNIKNRSIVEMLWDKKCNELVEAIENYMPEKCKECSYLEYCPQCPAFEWNVTPYSDQASELLCYYTKIAMS